MESLFEQLPEVIKNAGNSLYGLLAAIVITTGLLVVWLINQKATNRQERVLVYVILFFSSISIVVGIAAGFSTGTEVIVGDSSEQIDTTSMMETDPLSVTLKPDAMRKLEVYLEEQDIEISPEAKTDALGDAINFLIQLAPTSSIGSESTNIGEIMKDEVPGGTSIETAFDLKPLEATDSDYAWLGTSRINEVVPEKYHRLSLEKDSEVKLVWDHKLNPTILDGQGSTIRRFNLGTEGEIDLESGTYYIRVRSRYAGTYPRFDYEFRVFTNNIKY